MGDGVGEGHPEMAWARRCGVGDGAGNGTGEMAGQEMAGQEMAHEMAHGGRWWGQGRD